MIASAFRHEGTLDRIVGDAVAIMFSAPVPQADHRTRALACALEMDAFANTYNITSILQSRPSDAPPAVQDVPIAFNEATVCIAANVTINAI